MKAQVIGLPWKQWRESFNRWVRERGYIHLSAQEGTTASESSSTFPCYHLTHSPSCTFYPGTMVTANIVPPHLALLLLVSDHRGGAHRLGPIHVIQSAQRSRARHPETLSLTEGCRGWCILELARGEDSISVIRRLLMNLWSLTQTTMTIQVSTQLFQSASECRRPPLACAISFHPFPCLH